MGDVILHQFSTSHFNEKARWALDWKAIPHRRTTYLPGPHAFFIRRLSGQTATPVLQLEGRTIAGSAHILEALEERFPERPLFPKDPALRQRALRIQERFDREVGPAVRTALFSVLIHEPDYICRVFAGSKPWALRRLYRATLPLARRRIARANGTTDPENVARAFERSRQALDFVAHEVGQAGYLAGDEFSAADLCCASLLAPLVDPGHPDMTLPGPRPASLDAFLEGWSPHPALDWVREQYARHRPAPRTTQAA